MLRKSLGDQSSKSGNSVLRLALARVPHPYLSYTKVEDRRGFRKILETLIKLFWLLTNTPYRLKVLIMMFDVDIVLRRTRCNYGSWLILLSPTLDRAFLRIGTDILNSQTYSSSCFTPFISFCERISFLLHNVLGATRVLVSSSGLR